MAHSGKTMTFATDLLPHEDGIYNLGNADQKWKIFGDVNGTKITLGTSSSTGNIVIYDGSNNYGTIKTTSLSKNCTYTLPDATGTIALTSHNHDTIYSAIHQTSWSWAENGTKPLSKYVTFDTQSASGNAIQAPSAGWYNGFVTSHNNYLASFILNAHRSDKWYVGYEQYPQNDLPYTAPTWYLLAHSGNVDTGDADGQIKIAGINIDVKGLKSLAYKDNLVASDIPDISETYATNELVDGLLAAADAMIFKGTIGTDGTITAVPNGTSGKTYQAGYTYKVITAGKYANIQCEVGDLLIAISDSTSGQTTVNNAHWTVAQTNIDGAVTGPSSSTGNNIATFSGTTGRIIQDSEKAFSTATPSNSSTDDQIPTAKAVWTAIDALDGNLNSTIPGAGKTLTAFSQTNGKVSATFGNISITKSQVSDFAHTHGNLTNDGKIGSTANYAVYTTTSGKLTAGSLAVTDPNASGTATAFISTISQNSKGQITATKANLPALDTVKQSPAPTSNNDEYPILLKTTANANEETGTIKFSEPTITPKTGRLSATSFMVDSHVTLQWNSTDSSLDFIFV